MLDASKNSVDRRIQAVLCIVRDRMSLDAAFPLIRAVSRSLFVDDGTHAIDIKATRDKPIPSAQPMYMAVER